MSTVLREPAVAGLFYPDAADELTRALRALVLPAAQKARALACMVPHAGYIYSGQVAGAVYSRLELPSRFVILGPNHTGRGVPLSIMPEGRWRTPLGEAAVDRALADELMRACPYLEADSAAHRREHAIEVQLPFLQQAAPDFTFVPIALGTQHYDLLRALGEALAQVLRKHGGSVLLVASSDMNHYESDAITRAKDRKALDRILALDARGLHEAVFREHISMCGFGPAVAALTAALELGATAAQLVRYATSAEVSGDYDRVVGYAGVIVR
jgi:AmmeMemoRadiSam system protein B